ncbi:hypothetical protein BKA70DRAFT_336752 [Coprinopsis sp. MPI-PUGE-AT-0042]|nr:hypothetical protein BKA70DRAFT_336752 [Coprinopsis sp. MPI-PUGE-AT-0042]
MMARIAKGDEGALGKGLTMFAAGVRLFFHRFHQPQTGLPSRIRSHWPKSGVQRLRKFDNAEGWLARASVQALRRLRAFELEWRAELRTGLRSNIPKASPFGFEASLAAAVPSWWLSTVAVRTGRHSQRDCAQTVLAWSRIHPNSTGSHSEFIQPARARKSPPCSRMCGQRRRRWCAFYVLLFFETNSTLDQRKTVHRAHLLCYPGTASRVEMKQCRSKLEARDVFPALLLEDSPDPQHRGIAIKGNRGPALT